MKNPRTSPFFSKALLATALLAVPAFTATAQMARPEDSVAQHKAEVQKLSQEQADLQKKLDDAYSQIQEAKAAKERASITVVSTIVVCGVLMGGVLVYFLGARARARRELRSLSEALAKAGSEIASLKKGK
jgi:ABC-type Na+ efflux pump permease subunit